MTIATDARQRLFNEYLTADRLASYWSKKRQIARRALLEDHEVNQLESMSLKGGPRSTYSVVTRAHVPRQHMPEFVAWCKQHGFEDNVHATVSKQAVAEIASWALDSGIELPDYVSNKEDAVLRVYARDWTLENPPEDYDKIVGGRSVEE